MTESVKRCGYIAIIGRPNVGKSSLLNKILGQKISITSRKPQTTRHQILGIETEGDVQMIFVDTPGIHQGEAKALNRVMNRNAFSVMHGVDLIVFVVEALHWTDDDEWVLKKLAHAEAPVFLLINKVDQVKDKTRLLPFVEEIQPRLEFVGMEYISAKNGDHVAELTKRLATFMPERDFMYSEEEVTDRSTRFLAAEIIREKITRLTGQELPYAIAVEIEEFEVKKNITHISAVILVDKPGQKAILIGEGGGKMKEIGKQARVDIEALLDHKVFLRLWVKVKGGWADDDRALRSLGYGD